MTVIYVYEKCSTCRAALDWLATHAIKFEKRPIREQPPTITELRRTLSTLGSLKRLFNTSGLEYRALGIKDRLSEMGEDEALRLLAGNGMLVKRPLVLAENFALAGFRPEEWVAAFGSK
jgi:arsenate reductase (glutaredoxin)